MGAESDRERLERTAQQLLDQLRLVPEISETLFRFLEHLFALTRLAVADLGPSETPTRPDRPSPFPGRVTKSWSSEQ